MTTLNQVTGPRLPDTLNHTTNFTRYMDIIDSKLIQAPFCGLYTLIFVLGIFGNVLVCYVVFRNKAMQTVTNLFITNLALSDILLCIFAVPLTPMYTFLGKWIFGRVLCHLMPYAQGSSVYISTLTLTSIAIDRFLVIIYPFRPRMKLGTCISIILFIWFISLTVTFPYGYFIELDFDDSNTYCEESWPSEHSRKVFGTCTTLFQFVLPFIIIALCYTCVSIRLNDRARAKPGSKNSRREEADRDRKKRTNRMLISMVGIFGISWLPLNVINILNDFYYPFSQWKFYYVSFFLSHALAMASTCYNPFLYAWLNENFRKEFKQVLPCFDSTMVNRNSFQSGRLVPHRSEKTCNGNDTVQESLLGTSTNKTTSKLRSMDSNGSGTQKKQHIEIENIILDNSKEITQTDATYNPKCESVKLHLIDEEPIHQSRSIIQ